MATTALLLFPLALLLLWLLPRLWLQRYRGLRKWKRRPDHRTLFSDGPEALAAVRRDVPATRVLFVTAHPDDEAMFFAPTILAFKSASLWLLCSSTGEGGGGKREMRGCLATAASARPSCVRAARTHAVALRYRRRSDVIWIRPEGFTKSPAHL